MFEEHTPRLKITVGLTITRTSIDGLSGTVMWNCQNVVVQYVHNQIIVFLL